MNRKDKIKLHFNKYSVKYDEYAILQRNIANELFQLMSAYIEPNYLTLDVGCGTGYMQELFRKYNYNNFLLQLDLSYNMCKIAKSYSKENCSFTLCNDIEKIALEDDSFDHIVSSLVLQWTDYKISLSNIYNILKKNGYLFFSTFGLGTLNELSFCFNKIENISRIDNFLNKDQINKIMIDIGFKDINIKEINIVNHYMNTISIMHQIKNLGASYAGEISSYLTKNKLKMLESFYQINFGDNNILPVTWCVYLISARK